VNWFIFALNFIIMVKNLSLQLLAVILISALPFTGCANNKENDNTITMKTKIDTASYGIGINVANSLKADGITEVNAEMVAKAIDDVLKGKPLAVDVNAANNALNEIFTDGLKGKGMKFLEENKKREGVKVTASGLQYEIMTEGTGAKPTPTNTVKVHYHGTVIDGRVFDSSVDRGEPISFALNRVIRGWTEGLQLMSVGSKYKFYIPENLAYGKNPPPGSIIGPYETLIFEVELLGIQ